MTRDELIAELQELPSNLEIRLRVDTAEVDDDGGLIQSRHIINWVREAEKEYALIIGGQPL